MFCKHIKNKYHYPLDKGIQRAYNRHMDKKTNEIKELRELLMLNQQEFADVMAVDSGTISRWERGERRPKPVHLRRMARLSQKVKKGR